MATNFEKVLELAKKTGSSCIVIDSKGDPAYVLVSPEEYQKIILNKSEVAGMSQQELIDKINQDIAVWKNSTQNETLDNWQIIQEAMEDEKQAQKQFENNENSLNEGKKSVQSATDIDNKEKYYFEPID